MSDDAGEAVPGDAGPETPADTREAAIEAVKEATAPFEESEDEEKPKAKADDAPTERGKDGKFLPKDGKPVAKAKPEPKAEEEEVISNSKVAKLLREREERNEERQQIRQEREAIAREKAAFEAERAQVAKDREWLANLRKNPKLAVREAHKEYGEQWSPQDFIMALAQDSTTEGQLQREQMSTKEELANIKKMIADYTERETQYREQINQQHQSQQAQATEKRFVSTAMNEEKFPHLVDQYEGHEDFLIATAHKVGQDYHARTGEWATDEEIAEYLDGLRKERISKRTSSQSVGSALGKAPPVRAQGSRTISTAGASEKRVVTQSPDGEMTEEERREAAKAAVKQATREYAARG